MQLLGQYLKSEREKKGVRLEEIASSTKINIQNLVLMEEDRWKELPREPFIRGFITAYARYLSLDVQEALNKYRYSLNPSQGSSDENETITFTEDNPNHSSSSLEAPPVEKKISKLL